jgi:kinetochore protein Spc7/SPC105
MASSKKTSPKRRKSIAVTHQKKPVALPSRKRRAHSIVPGDRLSPKSKARRSLAPRKSILKASITLASEDDNNSSDNANTTAVFPDTRKSLGRRVSFAEHAHVRLFTKQNEQNTNSTASPQSSPVPAHDPAHVNDENAYPGSAAFRTRRSSARSSWGAESMDLENDNTAPNLSQFLRRDRGDDQDDSYDGEGEGDMEMTEALSNKINRKKSLSQSVRLPLTEVSTPKATSSHMVAAETSFVSSADEGESQQTQSSNTSLASNATDGDTETSLPIEYTIPTGRATAPASENPVWLALKNMTHSGGQDQEQSYEEEAAVSDEEALYPERQGDPELAEAQARLSAVRMALGLDDDEEDDDPANGVSREEQESFTSSSEDSGEIDAGDRTINLTGYLNRLRPSTISSGSAPMEETRMHQSATLEMQSRDSDSFTPEGPSPKGASMAAATEPPRLSVFSTPATKPVTPASASPSKQFDFSFTPKPSSASTPKVAIDKPTEKAAAPPPKPRPASPTKASGIPRPTAAFAAPVARVSPKKRAGAASGGGEAAAATPTKKRSASTREAESGSGAKPSPAKKVAVADRWNPNPSPVPVTAPTTSTTEAAGKGASSIKRLSPSKRAPFLAAQPQSQQNLEQGQEMPSLKNHLAKRKSLAVFPPAGAQTAVKALPKDKGKGRASVGSEPSNVWGGLIKEKDKENADGCEREKVRQSIALPSETRGSPRPASPRVAKVQDEHLQKENLALRLEATEQWRETLQDQSFTEETVRATVASPRFMR